MKPFQSLTARGQARRLRQLARNALNHYDLDVIRLSLITNSYNCIFRLDTRSGQKYILRVTLPEGGHTRDHVGAEMCWLAALARDTVLTVPRPLSARDGSMIVAETAPGVPETRLVEVFSWVPGVDLASHITPRNIERLGCLMAELHTHALSFKPPSGLSVLTYDRLFPFNDEILLFDPAYAESMSTERRHVFNLASRWVEQVINRLASCGEPMRIIHNDLHQWNVRIYRGVLSPIDFEDLMWGWPVQDIGTAMYYFSEREDYGALFQAFRTGYTHQNSWPERYQGEMNAFIAARALDLANFLLKDTNPDWRDNLQKFMERTEARLGVLLRQVESDQII